MIDQIAKRPLTIEQCKQIQRDLYELARPFVEAKCDVLAVSLPVIRYYPGSGEFETIYDDWTVGMLARFDELWTEARDHYIARIEELWTPVNHRSPK